MASGQIDDAGSAEVVLVDGESTETAMDVYSIDGGFARIDGKHSDGDRWRRAAVGRIVKQTGTKLDIVGIRSSSKPDKASILVYTMDGDNELSSDKDWQWAFAPQPEFVLLRRQLGQWRLRSVLFAQTLFGKRSTLDHAR